MPEVCRKRKPDRRLTGNLPSAHPQLRTPRHDHELLFTTDQYIDNRIFLPIRMAGHSTTALIDTGSLRSYINQEMMDQCRTRGLPFHPTTITQAVLANGQRTPITEECLIGCIIDGIFKRVTFLCLPALSTQVLLGIDAIRAWRMVIDYSTNQPQISVKPPDRQDHHNFRKDTQ
ncbi:hypothetical protein CBL_09646 [Carabus blaptoides fortunei]